MVTVKTIASELHCHLNELILVITEGIATWYCPENGECWDMSLVELEKIHEWERYYLGQ